MENRKRNVHKGHKQDKTISSALLQGSKGKTFALLILSVQLTQAERRIEELDWLFKHIYEDNANGKLSDNRFQMLFDDYEQEQEEQTENIDRFISKIRKYLDLDELTPAVLWVLP